MAAKPDDRYPAIGEMVIALEGYLDESGIPSDKIAGELGRYFGAPAPYEQALKERLVDHPRAPRPEAPRRRRALRRARRLRIACSRSIRTTRRSSRSSIRINRKKKLRTAGLAVARPRGDRRRRGWRSSSARSHPRSRLPSIAIAQHGWDERSEAAARGPRPRCPRYPDEVIVAPPIDAVRARRLADRPDRRGHGDGGGEAADADPRVSVEALGVTASATILGSRCRRTESSARRSTRRAAPRPQQVLPAGGAGHQARGDGANRDHRPHAHAGPPQADPATFATSRRSAWSSTTAPRRSATRSRSRSTTRLTRSSRSRSSS